MSVTPLKGIFQQQKIKIVRLKMLLNYLIYKNNLPVMPMIFLWFALVKYKVFGR
jgi:hypothetical protein